MLRRMQLARHSRRSGLSWCQRTYFYVSMYRFCYSKRTFLIKWVRQKLWQQLPSDLQRKMIYALQTISYSLEAFPPRDIFPIPGFIIIFRYEKLNAFFSTIYRMWHVWTFSYTSTIGGAGSNFDIALCPSLMTLFGSFKYGVML